MSITIDEMVADMAKRSPAHLRFEESIRILGHLSEMMDGIEGGFPPTFIDFDKIKENIEFVTQSLILIDTDRITSWRDLSRLMGAT